MNRHLPALYTDAAAAHEVRRWALSFATVVALHGGLILTAVNWPQHHPPAGAPPAAMLIELAPVPAAPATTPTEAPPVAQAAEEPPPPEPVPEPEPLPEPPPEPPPVEPEVALPTEPPPPPPKPAQPKPEPTETPAEKAQPMIAAAPPVAALQAENAAAPQEGISTLPPSNVLPDWQGLLLSHLERHKRYPREAQWRRQEGVTYLHFIVDRDGKVLEHSIDQSSGYTLLDEEVMELIERAQPLPPPPAELPGATLELVVPVQFFVRQR